MTLDIPVHKINIYQPIKLVTCNSEIMILLITQSLAAIIIISKSKDKSKHHANVTSTFSLVMLKKLNEMGANTSNKTVKSFYFTNIFASWFCRLSPFQSGVTVTLAPTAILFSHMLLQKKSVSLEESP